jgi:hypothetical protein
MGKKFCIVLLFSLSFLLFTLTGCQDSNRFAIGAKTGTLGLGGEFTAKVTPSVNWRVGYNTLDFDYDDVELDDVDYDASLDFSSFTALADWHLFEGTFRISGGVISMDHTCKLDGRLKEGATIDIGDNEYNQSQVGTLTRKVQFDKVAPYIGIGWGNPFIKNSRLGLACDLGIAFTGSPAVSVSSTGSVSRSDLKIEKDQIEDDLDVLKFYPVVGLSIYYRF